MPRDFIPSPPPLIADKITMQSILPQQQRQRNQRGHTNLYSPSRYIDRICIPRHSSIMKLPLENRSILYTVATRPVPNKLNFLPLISFNHCSTRIGKTHREFESHRPRFTRKYRQHTRPSEAITPHARYIARARSICDCKGWMDTRLPKTHREQRSHACQVIGQSPSVVAYIRLLAGFDSEISYGCVIGERERER